MKMIDTIYESIPDEVYCNYMDNLVNRVFKILPMKEEGSDTINSYITSLLQELTGNKELIVFLHNDEKYETILANLQFLLSEECNCRTIVLNTIPIIKQLKSKYCKVV